MSTNRNRNNRVHIMDLEFVGDTKKEFLDTYLYPRLLDQMKSYVVTANPEIVMRAREDAAYKKNIEKADYIVPDGAGIVLASKYMKRPVEERIPGYELMIDLLHFAEKKGLTCYFLGAKEHVNDKIPAEITRRYPNLKMAGRHHGYFSLDDKQVVHDVEVVSPDLVFVALGSPRQETWIANYLDQFSKGLFIGVGGSFDVLVGEVKRAPKFMINMNLEWLYRLLKQPFRWQRMLKAFEFMLRILLKGNKR